MRKQRPAGLFILLACIILFNGGCAGIMGRRMIVGNNGTYSELSIALPAISEGKGRVFVYMAGGGPSILNTAGILAEPLSIDNTMYFIAGKTFFHVDLDIGKHTVTASKTVKGFFKKTFCMGKNAIEFELLNQDIKYIKINIKGTFITPKFNTYYPILLESNQNAENEMRRLKLYTNHNRGMLGGTIWKIGDSFI